MQLHLVMRNVEKYYHTYAMRNERILIRQIDFNTNKCGEIL